MKKPLRRLQLILEYGQTANDFLTGKSPDQWRFDVQLRYAVAHALAGVVENLKEYAKDQNDFQYLKDNYPGIPWNLVIRFRDKLIHHYETLDQDTLYEFLTQQLPALLTAIQEIIEQNTPIDYEHNVNS